MRKAAKGENTNDEKKFYFTFIRFISIELLIKKS